MQTGKVHGFAKIKPVQNFTGDAMDFITVGDGADIKVIAPIDRVSSRETLGPCR